MSTRAFAPANPEVESHKSLFGRIRRIASLYGRPKRAEPAHVSANPDTVRASARNAPGVASAPTLSRGRHPAGPGSEFPSSCGAPSRTPSFYGRGGGARPGLCHLRPPVPAPPVQDLARLPPLPALYLHAAGTTFTAPFPFPLSVPPWLGVTAGPPHPTRQFSPLQEQPQPETSPLAVSPTANGDATLTRVQSILKKSSSFKKAPTAATTARAPTPERNRSRVARAPTDLEHLVAKQLTESPASSVSSLPE